MEQKIISRKTDDGYYVEVINDGKIVWTDTFKTEEELIWFTNCCDNERKLDGFYTSQEEGRKLLENGEFGVHIFYRHPMGYRFAQIYNDDAAPEYNKHGFQVFFVDNYDSMDYRIVSTIDEAFKIIKDVESGEI